MNDITQPTILMCPPTYFGIEYEINPWMDKRKQIDAPASVEQWQNLYQILNNIGAAVSLLEPVKHLPDLVFTANAGLIHKDQVYLSRFRHEARQNEVPHFNRWFSEAGFQVVEMPENYHFEGAGDALFCGETLFAGYLIRSDVKAHQWVAEQIDCRVIPLQLVDSRFYHVDTCFCPLSTTEAIYFPAAFDEYGQKALEEQIDTLIPVTEEEAIRFACNAVVVGKNVVLNAGCPQLTKDLTSRGYTVHATCLDEFLKSGGSAKCLTLRLDGEEAASWRYSG